jgi:hypothetical protein
MAWTRIGEVTVRPETDEVVVGVIDVPPEGGVELMVRQTSPVQGFRFAYGIVSYRSTRGRELGSVKAWAGPDWEAFRLGENLSALDRSGVLLFRPRSINLRWVRAGFSWSLEFMADIGADLPADRHQAPGFEDPVNRILPLVRVGTQGRLQF